MNHTPLAVRDDQKFCTNSGHPIECMSDLSRKAGRLTLRHPRDGAANTGGNAACAAAQATVHE